ncbi:hypothetical protein GWI33_000875 [Rhynchophorus ferrugineus]|uniref:Uncharacterized protein n=1 Tax=Rhynchophorus ferrugineus TaxID=354439 RepID=A0A834IMG0_RHYFE|nr:hypothetical protein GWI33_000875 [Rhynchophorus ferrugineus]
MIFCLIDVKQLELRETHNRISYNKRLPSHQIRTSTSSTQLKFAIPTYTSAAFPAQRQPIRPGRPQSAVLPSDRSRLAVSRCAPLQNSISE